MFRVVIWALFLFAAFFVIYSIVGYPLLLAAVARLRARPLRKEYRDLKVTIVLPVFNGEKWIAQKLRSIQNLDYPRECMQVLVISDGSTDATVELAKLFSGVEVVCVPKGGKSLAVNKGISLAQGEIVFFTDARQVLDKNCLRELVSCFADPDVGGVCGELLIADGETLEEASIGLYWRIEKWVRLQLSAVGTLLVVTGCLYAVRRELASPLPPGALADDIFIPQSILRRGYRVIFEPAARAYDYPTSRDVEFRRKVRTLAGLYQYVGKHGFGPHWFHFFSYKVTRLLLPHMLILSAITSFLLPAPFSFIALSIQAVFYGLAAIDDLLPENSVFKRVSSPARTFCMLMAASLVAVSVLFVPPASLWKTTHVKGAKLPG
jgi:biofilm PGA synthesis N-glycosyltransferase PgaC